MSVNSFGAKSTLTVGEESYEIFRLDAVEGADTLPYSLKILLENLLRTEDGANITADDIRALAGWDPEAEPSKEIQFTPARVIMQDFTGVPCVVDLATMREAMAEMGGDATKINPLAPAELVIDHSVIADVFGTADAFTRNVEIEYGRNRERYQFLRWGQTAFDDFKVVPPGTGIVHQVNIEHLARVIFSREVDGVTYAYPDTCVGTDSHTTMVNGLGVVGWGVGGIEAEAAMLGQPVSMLIPRVVGFKLSGAMPEGATATDLVLTITEMLRQHKVVGKFVEFYGPGVSQVPLANRATIGNMSPEYGSTIAVFPIDGKTIDYLRLTGRSAEQIALVETYAREQGLWHDDDREPKYSEYLELDLGTVVPSIAGPKRPQDRVILAHAKQGFREALMDYVGDEDDDRLRRVGRRELPRVGRTQPRRPEASRREPHEYGEERRRRHRPRPSTPTPVDAGRRDRVRDRPRRGDHRRDHVLHQHLQPEVMIGAALVAKKAVERGLTRKPWVKTTLAPGSKVVSDYYDRSGLTAVPGQDRLQPGRLRLHHLHRQLGPADPRGQCGGSGVRPGCRVGAVRQPELRGSDQPRRQDELPRLAAAGGRVRDRRHDGHRPGATTPLGTDEQGQDVYLQGHLADRGRDRRGRRLRDRGGDVHRLLRRRVRRRRAVAVAAHAGG